ncbi:hypothetical protein [Paenibacillus wulumuqiensis]|nr:hypothetical protein [Paenibacillus wulumuqiensis]
MDTQVKQSDNAWSRANWAEAGVDLVLHFPGMVYRFTVCILACMFGS